MKSFILTILMAAACGLTAFAPAAEAAVIYVDASAGGSDTGTSWHRAHTDLQDALARAADGDEIWVAAGTYSPGSDRSDTFTIKDGVGVYGGFDGTETRRSHRDPGNNVTVLSGGDSSLSVVTADSGVTASAVLDGLTVTGGYSRDVGGRGAGMFCEGSPTVRDCTFRGSNGKSGGAIYSTGSPVISGCTFVGNDGVFGILYNGGTVRLENCTFAGNDSHLGVIYNNSSATVVNCTFAGNSTWRGGGIYNEGSLTLRNTLLADNTALAAGGHEDFQNKGSVTAVRNLVEHSDGYTPGPGDITGEQPDLRLGTFDFHGGATKTYALLPGSVAIDAGSCASAVSPDQRGISRPQGAGCDIGAFEARFVVTLGGNSVDENEPPGTAVGTLGTDPDFGDTCTYTVISGGTYFRTPGDTLVTRARFDHESRSSYSVRVEAECGGAVFTGQFTVYVNDIHEKPEDIGPAGMSVYENLPAGTAICDFVSHPDDDDEYTYELISGPGDDDNSLFSIDGTALKTGEILSYADRDTRSILVRTTDENSDVFEKQFTVRVLHQGPTGILLSNDTVDENMPDGTVIGDFSAEPDMGYSLTYETVPGTGAGDNDAFVIDGAALKIVGSPDYETKQSLSIRVRVTDSEEAFYEKQFSVTVNDFHEPPEDISLSRTSVTEALPPGTPVGILTTYPDSDDEYTYEVISGGGNFTADGNRLVTAAVFEYVEFTNNEYTVQVKVTDENSETFTQTFTVTVLETVPNSPPTSITLSSTEADADSRIGTEVGTFTVTDPDPDDGHVCTLTAGDGDEDNGYFSIARGDTLTVLKAFDETQESYSIRVLCEDGRGGSSEKNFTVTLVTNRPPTDISLSSSEADEGMPGIIVGILSASDPDNPGDTETFTLLSGTGVFRIDGNRLVTTAPLDSVTQSSHGIRVRVTDSGGESYDESFTVNVLNVNDPPTDIFPDDPSVPENQPAGTPVAVLTADDPDPGDTHTFSLPEDEDEENNTDNEFFLIEGDTLLTDALFDYEEKADYSIRVRAEDSGGAAFEKILVVRITDVNEAPSDMTLAGSESGVSIPENTPAGAVLGKLGVTDSDSGDSHRYYRVVHAHLGWTDNSSFSLDPAEGIIRTAGVFDHEEKDVRMLYIRCNDSGGCRNDDGVCVRDETGECHSPGCTGSCFRLFTINVTDVNEPPAGLTLNPGWVREEQPAGAEAGTLVTHGDPDADETHIYTLVSGDGDEDNARFVIEDNILRTAEVLNFEAGEHPFHIRVRTEDSGGTSQPPSHFGYGI